MAQSQKGSSRQSLLSPHLLRRCGRPKRLSEQEIAVLEELYFQERLSVRKVADVLHVSHMTVWRALCDIAPAGSLLD